MGKMYFDCEDEEMLMDFNKLFKQSEENDADPIIMDDLGQLLKFMISCVVMTKEYHQRLNCDIKIYEEILAKLIEKSSNATNQQLHIFSSNDSKNSIIIMQFLNCCEALMLYCYYQMTRHKDEEYRVKLLLLFEKYREIKKENKKMFDTNNKRAAKSDKKSMTLTAIDGELRKTQQKIDINTKSIWSLKECVAFLKLIFDVNQNEQESEFKKNKEFCQFVLATTSQKLAELDTTSEHSKIKYSRTIFESFLSCSTLFYQQLHTDNFIELHDNYSKDCAASLSDAFRCVIQAIETTYDGKTEKFNQLLKAMLQKNSNENHQHNQDDYSDLLLLEVIQRIHRIIEWAFEQEKKSAASDFISSPSISSILSNLFSSLQILYGKFNSATKSRECFNWILNFAKKTSVKQKPLAVAIIKLFIQCINLHENSLLIECVAHKIASCYQYRRTMTEPECASQNNFAIISKQISADEAFSEFIEFMKETLIVVEIYIKRSNSFNAHVQLRGQESHDYSCTALHTLETAICTKVIALGKAIERIASSKFPISTRNIEKIVGIIKLYYNCLINLMKHFRKHHKIKNIDSEIIGLDNLIKFSRKFAACVYSIAPYIERAAEDDFAKGKKGEDSKARIKKRDAILSKETKTIPRMIFLIETFNTQVANFDTAAKKSLSKFLHPGEVRDFHIGNKLLKDAIVRSQESARSQTFEDDEEIEDDDDNNDGNSTANEDMSDNENIQPNTKRKRRLSSTSSSSTDNDDDINLSEDESEQSVNPTPTPQKPRSIRIRMEKNKRVSRENRKLSAEKPAATGRIARRKK